MSCIYMLLLLSGHLCFFFMVFVVGVPLGPRITLRPLTGEVIQGQNFTITCHTQHPEGTVHLEFNGFNITSPCTVHSISTPFPFDTANSSLSGNYSCVYVTAGPIGNHTFSRSDMVIVNVTVSEEDQKFESIWVFVLAGSAGGAVLLLLLILLCVCLTCKSRTYTEAVTLSTHRSRPVQGEDLDLEPDYEDIPSEGSGTGNINMEIPARWKGCNDGDTPSENSNASYINVEIPEKEEDDYVNIETMEMCNAPACDIDSDIESDYENFAFLRGTAN